MKRKPVKSEKLTSIGYDKAAEVLEIEFPNGSIYQYYNVPPKEYRKLMKASCIHRYMNLHIRSVYPYKSLG